jgi:hypothetical protein
LYDNNKNNFSQGKILEEGAFGIVYKGLFPYGTIVVVKRLKGHVSVVGDTIKMCVQNAGVYRVKNV